MRCGVTVCDLQRPRAGTHVAGTSPTARTHTQEGVAAVWGHGVCGRKGGPGDAAALVLG